MLGGAEMPALWAIVFLAATVEAALHFLSWAKLEDELAGPEARERFATYLGGAKVYVGCLIVLRVAAVATFIALVVRGTEGGARRTVASVAVGVGLLTAGELAGRMIGRKWSAGVLRVALPVLYRLAWPLKAFYGGGPQPTTEPEEEPEPEVVDAAKEEIRVALADGTTEGAIEAEEKLMIEGILKFGEVDVAQIMTPRTEIEYIDVDTPLESAVEQVESFHHSRIPVCEETLDEVGGIAYVKDLLSATSREEASLRSIMREPFFVPETNTVDSLLQQFRQQRVQIAVVLDEYGGTAGVVTVEDVLEEIVGEIEDEYDVEGTENRIRMRSSGGVEADARVRIDELNEMFDLDIPEDQDFDSIGGFVTDRFARVPEPGEEFRANGLLVRILQSDERRVRRVFIKRLPEEEEGAEH